MVYASPLVKRMAPRAPFFGLCRSDTVLPSFAIPSHWLPRHLSPSAGRLLISSLKAKCYNRPRNGNAMARTIKRILDVCAASIGLVVLSPVFGAVAVLILLNMGLPVVFRDQRGGLCGRPFTFLKFRSMTADCDAAGRPLPDECRLTRVGRFLRRTSLDELPQLWNVLRGDMSLVGPRPLPVEYLPLYSPDQFRRHEVPPGIVGWAVVNGRNANTWEKKFELDVFYVDNWSLAFDLRILLLAIATVISGSGVSEEGQATASRFTGTTGSSVTREIPTPKYRPTDSRSPGER
jgi:lipopolysaccharide/colanic/teichoic acid biosynthesis glycosyltransferase